MKTINFFRSKLKCIVLLVLCLSSLRGAAQYPFKIRIEASPMFEGKWVYLLRDNNHETISKKFTLDSVKVKGGIWEFEGEMKEPCNKARLRAKVNGVSCEARFIIDPGLNSMKLDSIQYIKYLSLVTPETPSNLLYKEMNSIKNDIMMSIEKKRGSLQGQYSCRVVGYSQLIRRFFHS